MSWTSLVVAGIFEVFWATSMKLSNGFSKLNFSILTVIGMILSLFLSTGNQTFKFKYYLSCMDRDWSYWVDSNWCSNF